MVEIDNLVLLNDVAGYVRGDRQVLVQTQVDLDHEDKGAAAEDEEILNLFDHF